MTEIPKSLVEQPADPAEYGRDLSYAIEAARRHYQDLVSQYGQLPPEVLAELAWKGIAWYHGGDGVAVRLMHGVGSPEDLGMERIKDQRLAALPDEEARNRAIAKANSWLDEHFSQ